MPRTTSREAKRFIAGELYSTIPVMNFKKAAFFAFCIALCLVPTFLNAWRFHLPVGYGGMFASFGEQLAEADFILPKTGQGGIPYVYPPLGFYAHAVFLKLGISTWFYLRWLVPFYTLAALIAFGAVYARLFGSKVWAVAAVVLAASAPYLVESHVWAAGMVRGLAFALFLLALTVFLRLQPDSDWKLPALAGFFSGLTVLSHLGYAYFLALWMGVWLLFHRDLWKQAALVAGFAVLTVLPWLAAVLANHPFDVFLNALRSHNTLEIFSALGNPQAILSVLWVGLSKLFEIPLLGWMALSGAGWQLYRKRWEIPAMLAATLLFHLQSRRFVVVLGIFLAVSLLQDWTTLTAKNRLLQRSALALAALLMLIVYAAGLSRVAAVRPALTDGLLDAARYLQENAAPQSEYFILADYNETEWFPYLSRRNPIIPWAREWEGNLGGQTGLLLEAFYCGQDGDVACVERVIRDVGRQPQYLVVMKRKYPVFLEKLEQGKAWRRVYNNPEYQVWEKR